MSYSYEKFRPFTLTDEGQRRTMDVLDKARAACKFAGAVSAGTLLQAAGSGDCWESMACVERLVELGYLKAVPCWNAHVAWQNGIFLPGGRIL